MIGSALNRGVFEEADWGEVSNYYQSTTHNYNYYSKKLHEKALDNKCYAFPYDDFFKQDTTVSAKYTDIKLVTVTIPEMPEKK